MKSNIRIEVTLDEDRIPKKIYWSASDQGQGKTEGKAFLLSIFDQETRDTLKIDLWTKEMQLNEMDHFVYHTIKGLADTYARSTNNISLANEMQKFAAYFGEKTKIISSSGE